MRCGTNSLNSITRRGDRRVVKWERPADGWYKVNSDGAVRTGDGVAASGGVIRDSHGRWLRGFSRSIEICSVMETEAWVVYDGLVQAWQMGGRRVVLEIDSATLVQMLLGCEAENQGSGALRAAKECSKGTGRLKCNMYRESGTQ